MNDPSSSGKQDYIAVNRASWNNKVRFHLESDFYDVAGFLKGASSLHSIELNLLGDIEGKRILHLQCHFGQDTISLARMGARVTGIDLSDKAIDAAKELTQKTTTAADFICCDLYELPQHLNETFDIVFTSYGTIGWLPDLDKWAAVISRFLKPAGTFVFAEFHPVVWMFDDDFKNIGYSYFNTGAITETYEGTYADRNANLSQSYVMWNHGLGEVMNSLIRNGLEITRFEEFDYSPHNCFQDTVEIAPKKYGIRHLVNKIPMVYALTAVKRSLIG
ncbi:class I SAM-dependent methyltransferase [Niabella beijingensis]|uniref:class I SAM-dependent methyltransferase n=1 Tax=Niabella beijingensis TaxID=2872700 RepID=UPI001CBD6EEE|nr:class I SAM-dependent methyltransferase [Niabella beijingensis]MBZ4188984.1 class I SAM-dependent methyltransferase [Niabella beijingensis]